MESKTRSIAKALSWRAIATLITFFVAWFLTGTVDVAVKIGLLDTSLKLASYYFHERAWIRSSFGKLEQPNYHI